MIKLYLITGFLGAGKTSFLKKFIPTLSPMRMHLIINEFGKESVDAALLETLEASLDQINNGSIFCACKIDAFEESLKIAIDDAPDCIIVEASGLADPTSIRSLIESPHYKDHFDYKGAICLVDAKRFEKVYTTARCVKKQLAASDLVLLNKTDTRTEEQLKETEKILKMQRPDIAVHRTSHGDFEMSWIDGLEINHMNVEENYKATVPDISILKFKLQVNSMTTLEQLTYFLNLIAEDTYRIKGFVRLRDELMLINCVGKTLSIAPYSEGHESNVGSLYILSGNGLPIRKSLKLAIQHYEHLFTLLK